MGKIKFQSPNAFSSISGDIAGGLSSALMALPGNIVFGLIAFSPLGPAYTGQAILAGIYASVFAGFSVAIFGGIRGMISGPRAPMAFVFASVIGQLLATGCFGISGLEEPALLLTLGFATVFLSGIFQALFGALRLGRLVKYISFPVIVGIKNGTAILILTETAWGYLGIEKQDAIWKLFSRLDETQPLAFCIALTASVLCLRGERWIPRIPGALLGLLGGSALYYFFTWIGFGSDLGETLGALPSGMPAPEYLFRFIDVFSDWSYSRFFPAMAAAALTIAILGAVESLLAMLAMQNLTLDRGDANRELIGQGIGNMANAVFGAIPAAGASSRVVVNYRAGGRGRLSGVAFSLITLVVILFGSRYVSLIPQSVIAGMALVVGLLMIDRWSLWLMRELFRKGVKNRKELMFNAAIMASVAVCAVAWGIIAALGLGIILSVLSFVEQMSRSIVRRISSGSAIRSKKQRYIKVMELLNTHGDKIAIIELDGAIFFGTADNLLTELDKLTERGVSHIILDMKRVSRIDLTGERVLEQIANRFAQKGTVLAFSYLHPERKLWDFLRDLGFMGKVKGNCFFPDTDRALEFCEDDLLKNILPDPLTASELTVFDFLGLNPFTDGNTDRIERYFKELHFNATDRIFNQGDPGDSAYILSRGSVDVTIHLPDSHRIKRLVTLTYGTIFGEMALLDSGSRSADVLALEPVKCYKISVNDFQTMRKEDPDLALIFLETLSRILAERLRQANLTVAELER